MKKKISITLSEKLLKDIDSIIDYIYIRNRSQAIEYLVQNSLGENKAAVILSGGKPDYLRISDDEFRITARIGKSTVIEKGLRKLKENGFRQVYLVADKKVLTKVFEIVKDGAEYGVLLNYIEDNEAKGTAHSLKLLKGKISSNFLVVYGDIVFEKINIEQLWEDHVKLRGLATLMLTSSSKPHKKGVVKIEGNRILEFVQKPKESDIFLGFSSIFCAEPDIFEYEGRMLEDDVFPLLAQRGLLNGHLSSERELHIHTKKDAKSIYL